MLAVASLPVPLAAVTTTRRIPLVGPLAFPTALSALTSPQQFGAIHRHVVNAKHSFYDPVPRWTGILKNQPYPQWVPVKVFYPFSAV